MAQVATLQPGDEKENEGHTNDDAKVSTYGNYRCVFRVADDSLYLLMKNQKTKRSFSNTFSKSTLIDMELRQPIDQILNLLQEAKSGTKSELSYKIGFGEANNNKKVSFDKLSKSYKKGDALYISAAIDHTYFKAQYNFKLLEQKRNETDILRDIMADMQEEIDALKIAQPAIVVFKSSGSNKTRPVTWDLESIPSTLNGMVVREDNNKKIVIGVTGTYRLTVRFSYLSSCGGTSNHGLYIHLNGTEILRNYSIGYLGGNIVDVQKFTKGDKIHVQASCDTASNHTWSKATNIFMLEKL